MMVTQTEEEKKDEETEEKLYETVSMLDMYNLQQQYIDLYDLRPSNEYNKSHIQEATNIPDPNNFDKFSEEYTLPIVVYGDSNIVTTTCNHLYQIATSQNKQAHFKVFDGNYCDFHQKYSFLCESSKNEANTNENEEEEEGIFYPAMIEQRLYLGDIQMAQNKKIIKDLKVTHILNLTRCESKLDDETKSKLTYLQIKIEDSQNEIISAYFDKASNFIYRALDANKKNVVFVHCMSCQSIAPTIIVAYLLNSRGDPLIDCYLHTKKCYPKMSPNRGFYNQLIKHEKDLLGESTGFELESALNSKEWTFNYFQGTWDMS